MSDRSNTKCITVVTSEIIQLPFLTEILFQPLSGIISSANPDILGTVRIAGEDGRKGAGS